MLVWQNILLDNQRKKHRSLSKGKFACLLKLLVTEEPEVRIPLSTSSARPRREVRVNHMIGRYEPEVGIQTEPRPSTTFGATVGFSNVHDAYRLHQQALAASRKQQKLFPHKKDNKDGGKQRECVLASGLVDGTVMYIDGRLSQAPQVLTSVATDGKHLLPVSQVRWGPAEAGRMPYFYSASADGRVSEWAVRPSTLDHTDILDFYHCPPHRSRHFTTATLRGTATCLAVNPREGSVVLVGVDTGVVLQLNTTTTLHHLTQYPAHTAPVRAVAWNTFHHRVFATCSLDWMIKIWLQYHTSPLIVLDLGAPVTGLAWSSSSSTVVVGVTDEGRVHVYDLFVRRCRPACVQSVLQRRRSALSCVAFSPFHHIIVVGGERGYLLTLKLSPNLRRVHRTSGEQTPREAQVHLLDSIIATTRGPHAPPRP
nr:dynein intermediate chain 2, ciliary-like [Procambarus clarkii]